MPFTNPFSVDIKTASIGSQVSFTAINVAHNNFIDNLKGGVGVSYDTALDKIINFDNTKSFAGVVIRNPAGVVEAGDTIDSDIINQITVMRQGLIVVDLKVGETPEVYGAVFIEDATGKAQTTGTGGTAIDAEFIEQVSSTSWVIRLK